MKLNSVLTALLFQSQPLLLLLFFFFCICFDSSHSPANLFAVVGILWVRREYLLPVSLFVLCFPLYIAIYNYVLSLCVYFLTQMCTSMLVNSLACQTH